MRRRLLAIMFTDIVGFTAMMGADEEKTISRLRSNRELHKKYIKTNHGTWVKELGDGVLCRFDSALDAVKCAISIQRAVGKLDFKLRIGIHLADVSIENGDIFGDGVNLASRIQSAAQPGSIFITDAVERAVRSISHIKTSYVGDLKLKNVAFNTPTYCILGEGLVEVAANQTKAIIPDSQPSIAVLPFKSLSEDSAQQYIVDGMQDALIGQLAQIGSLRVISRTSMMRYRETELSITEIALELGVENLVEATVLEAEKIAHIQVQLIKAMPSEDHLWASGYSEDMRNIYALYNEVVKDITKNIHAKLSAEDKNRIETVHEVDPEAYKAYLRGIFHWEKLSESGLQLSYECFDQAIRIDPGFAPAYSGKAGVWVGRIQMGIVSPREGIPPIYRNLRKTQHLEAGIPEIHFWKAFVGWIEWDWKMCLDEFQQLLMLSPNHALGAAYYSHALVITGNTEESIRQIEKAVNLDPFNPLILGLYAMQLNFTRNYDRAIEVIHSIPNHLDNHPVAFSTLRTIYHNKKMYDEAYGAFKKSYEARADSELVAALDRGYQKGGYHKALEEVAEQMLARLEKTYVRDWEVATLLTRAGVNDRALEFLEKAYRSRDANMPYLGIDPIFDDLKQETGFQILLGKMQFESDVVGG